VLTYTVYPISAKPAQFNSCDLPSRAALGAWPAVLRRACQRSLHA